MSSVDKYLPRSTPRRWWRRGILLSAVVGLGALGVRAKLTPREVDLQPARRGLAIDAVYATATVEATDRVSVQTKVGGTVNRILVREGDLVKRGDLLATLDTASLQQELAKSEADRFAALEQASSRSPSLASLDAQMEMTRTAVTLARNERDRLVTLASTGSTPRVDLERAASQVRSLEAQLASQEAQRRAQEVDLSARASGASAVVRALGARVAEGELRSPIEGVVIARLIAAGEVAAPNAPLFRIGDARELVLEAWVDEGDVARVVRGGMARASLRAFPRETFDGEVTEVAPDADRSRKAYLVKVRLKQLPTSVRPGMSADVNIVTARHDRALLVPNSAVDADGCVWVASSGRATRHHVDAGLRDLERTEVLAGLTEGDLVVVDPDGLTEGARVAARGAH